MILKLIEVLLAKKNFLEPYVDYNTKDVLELKITKIQK